MKTNTGKNLLLNLIDDLPEIYQPIYKHEELPLNVSRQCIDRWPKILDIYRLANRHFKRPLRILDLGCAQGFFSLKLASIGATVFGIDYNDKNIALCQYLASLNPSHKVQFELNDIQTIVSILKPDQFDIVLGLSVFHHLVHEQGLFQIQQLIETISVNIPMGIYELALREEPLYWAESLPEDPLDLISSYKNIMELSKVGTHLSSVNRPLIAATSYLRFDD